MVKYLKLIYVLVIAEALSYYAEALYSPIYAFYIEKLGGNILETGAAWSAYLFAIGVSSMVFGKVEEKIKNKKFLVSIGFIIAGITSMLFGFVNSILQLVILQILLGITWAAVNPSWDYLFSTHISKKEGTFQWSLYEGSSRIAMALGSATGGFVAYFVGFKALFAISGILDILAGILILTTKE